MNIVRLVKVTKRKLKGIYSCYFMSLTWSICKVKIRQAYRVSA